MEYKPQEHELREIVIQNESTNHFASQVQQDVKHFLQSPYASADDPELTQIFSLQNELSSDRMLPIEFEQSSEESWGFKKFPYLLAATGAGLVGLEAIGFYLIS